MGHLYRAAVICLLACGSLSLLAQNRADPQRLQDKDSFSMILLGDPQGYTKYDIYQPIFELCTAWIADNVPNLNIRAVLCTGDLVEQNESFVQDDRMVNQTSREMWESASRSLARLDGKVPYVISPGNHDYGYRRSENGMTHFPEYFPFERNPCWRDICVAAYPNRNGIMSIENAAFELEDANWGSLLIVTTEFAPRDEVLDWVSGLISQERYRNHKVIFMTHSFLYENTAERTDNESYSIAPRNWGKAVWEKLVSRSSNIVLVICGHKGHPGGFNDSVAYRVDKNAAGRPVHQMMFNVQAIGGGWDGNGGDGWLRILEFMPDGKTIKVRTYSPLFGISPATRHLAYRTESYDQFDMVIK
ncbi:MAG: metallophosphoesterase [Clostridium sp.]|nr:metallophosphoesterase [Bacteroides sp.]MCM1197450.1 metallophosphoesterase [Clostridium sp.]